MKYGVLQFCCFRGNVGHCVGIPFWPDISTSIHNDPAAHQDHCGICICRIPTRAWTFSAGMSLHCAEYQNLVILYHRVNAALGIILWMTINSQVPFPNVPSVPGILNMYLRCGSRTVNTSINPLKGTMSKIFFYPCFSNRPLKYGMFACVIIKEKFS